MPSYNIIDTWPTDSDNDKLEILSEFKSKDFKAVLWRKNGRIELDVSGMRCLGLKEIKKFNKWLEESIKNKREKTLEVEYDW